MEDASLVLTGCVAAEPDWANDVIELTLASDPVAVRLALGRVTARLAQQGADDGLLARCELVLAEVLNNVVEHALRDEKGGRIRFEIAHDVGGLQVKVVDEGRPMPGGTLPIGALPAAEGETCDLPEGGFGWSMIHQLTEEIRYSREDGRNVLRFSMTLGDDAT